MSHAHEVRSTTASGSKVYESQRAVHEYLHFHFGDEDGHIKDVDGLRSALNFAERCATLCSQAQKRNVTRALDVGCSVGGSAFHLSKHFNEVVGIDFSEHFVTAAKTLQSDGQMDYDMLVEGDTFQKCTALLPKDIDRSKVRFQQGDACSLSADLGGLSEAVSNYCWSLFILLFLQENLM